MMFYFCCANFLESAPQSNRVSSNSTMMNRHQHVPLEESDVGEFTCINKHAADTLSQSEDHSSYPMQSTTDLPQYSSHPFNEYESPFQYPRSPPQPNPYVYAPVQESTIVMPEAQRMPEPEAQVFTSEEATHGPNPNPMPTGIELYDAPYTNPSDPFVDDDRMPIRRLNSETEGMGLLRPGTALSGSTHAPSGATPSVSGDDFDEVGWALLNYVHSSIQYRILPSVMVEYRNAFQEDTRRRNVSNFRTVTLFLIAQFRRVYWICVTTEKAMSLLI